MPDLPDPFPERLPYIGIYATPQGINAIGSPVKVRILDMLARRDMAFDDLVEQSGRAKSTVSVHLKDLAAAGIVSAKPDPHDGRKKIFSLHSLFLAGADSRSQGWFVLDSYVKKEVPCEGDQAAMYRMFLSTIRLTLMNQGFSIDPILHLAGRKAGETLYHCIEHPTIEGMVDRITKLWENNGLGSVELEQRSPLTLKIRDCFECIDLPVSGKPACTFDSGILSSLFSRYYEQQMRAIETHCYAMGSGYCRFEVRESGAHPGQSWLPGPVVR
jgi:hypothetical protein